MREVLIGAVALVLGVVVGGLAPRAQVRSLQEEIAAVETAECRPEVGRELATLMTRPPVPVPAPDPDPVTDTASAQAAELPTDEVEVPEVPEEGIETMRAALELRRSQARAALMEDARPDEAQLEDFDQAIAEMNEDLRAIAEDAVYQVQNYGEPTRHEMMVFAADTLDVLIVAEERMWGALDPDQLGAADDASVDPFSYVDPALLDLFAELDQ